MSALMARLVTRRFSVAAATIRSHHLREGALNFPIFNFKPRSGIISSSQPSSTSISTDGMAFPRFSSSVAFKEAEAEAETETETEREGCGTDTDEECNNYIRETVRKHKERLSDLLRRGEYEAAQELFHEAEFHPDGDTYSIMIDGLFSMKTQEGFQKALALVIQAKRELGVCDELEELERHAKACLCRISRSHDDTAAFPFSSTALKEAFSSLTETETDPADDIFPFSTIAFREAFSSMPFKAFNEEELSRQLFRVLVRRNKQILSDLFILGEYEAAQELFYKAECDPDTYLTDTYLTMDAETYLIMFQGLFSMNTQEGFQKALALVIKVKRELGACDALEDLERQAKAHLCRISGSHQ